MKEFPLCVKWNDMLGMTKDTRALSLSVLSRSFMMVWKERMKHLSTSYGTLSRVLSSLLVKRASGAPFLCSTSDRSVVWRRFPTSVGFHVREIAKMPSIHPSAGLCCEACGAKFACFQANCIIIKKTVTEGMCQQVVSRRSQGLLSNTLQALTNGKLLARSEGWWEKVVRRTHSEVVSLVGRNDTMIRVADVAAKAQSKPMIALRR